MNATLTDRRARHLAVRQLASLGLRGLEVRFAELLPARDGALWLATVRLSLQRRPAVTRAASAS